jgi:CheY-like chemotaxis protein
LPERLVLIVDDNRDAAESLAMLLRLLGAKVQVAHNGFDALSQVNEFQPAIVVLDLGMPGMDGYEVAREIRRQPQFAHVVLVALTGWAQDEDRLRSQNAGFNLHLTKPADFATFESLLQALPAEASPTVLSQTFQGGNGCGENGSSRLPFV